MSRISRNLNGELASRNGPTPTVILPSIEKQTPYKISSQVNGNRSQVRFSIPDPNLIDDDCSYISISNSPQKIVFPKEPINNTDGEEEPTSIYSDIIAHNNHNNTNVQGISQSIDNKGNALRDKLNLVDMQSKIMIDVPESIWRYHKEHRSYNNNGHTRHRKTQSLHNVFNPYRDAESVDLSGESPVSAKWTPSHKRSKSLQSIIADTVKMYHEEEQERSIEDHTLSIFNETVSTVSPLNIRQQNTFTNASRRHDLFLTSESPLNKYKVSVPLEINLPPYLSPQNKNKNVNRNSLIYNGNGYSILDENTVDISEESNSIQESITESEKITDSLINDDSLPYAMNDISIDVGNKTGKDTDIFLGIDNEANVNLKLQNKNIRSNSKSPQKRTTQQTKEKYEFEKDNRTRNVSSCIGNDTAERSRPNSRALEILSTPSKSIVIPSLDNDEYQTPKNPSSNGTLTFFENFEPLRQGSHDVFKTHPTPNREQGILNMEFKFPFNNNVDNNRNIPKERTEDNSMDFLKVAPLSSNKEFETRRQRLLQNQSASNSPIRKIGHAHRRTKSVHNIDFTSMTDGNNITELVTQDTSFNATSTPPKADSSTISIPERSSLRTNTSPSISSPIITISPALEKTDDSIVFISHRKVKQSHTMPDTLENRPMSSFQSFNTPVSRRDVENIYTSESSFIPENIINNKTIPIRGINSLSPRRRLSNNESNPSTATSYTNSEFSKGTFNTVETDMSAVEEIEEVEILKRSNIPQNIPLSIPPKKNNDNSFEIIKELKNGKEVEVIVIDNEKEEDPVKEKSKGNKKNSRAKVLKERDYESILNMCEDAALQAKDIIYNLVSETEPLRLQEKKNRSQNRLSAVDERRQKYLQKFNRTIKVNPKIKETK
ncbi:hypothetical protein C6P45_003625 [Maudiozyma exigua]|uniref:Uncharacterized protein n=1 Tax=Maudiozyma exigua TaxID=34358 RepID=A0A9P6WED5_MAUEX|nr:hypothetical protein C6P45_003625 [Kazachstania exigua]